MIARRYPVPWKSTTRVAVQGAFPDDQWAHETERRGTETLEASRSHHRTGVAVVGLPVALVLVVKLTTARAESLHEWSAADGWLMPLIQIAVAASVGTLLVLVALAVRSRPRWKS